MINRSYPDVIAWRIKARTYLMNISLFEENQENNKLRLFFTDFSDTCVYKSY